MPDPTTPTVSTVSDYAAPKSVWFVVTIGVESAISYVFMSRDEAEKQCDFIRSMRGIPFVYIGVLESQS